MTETRTLTDLVPGGGTVELTVTARTSNLDIESTIGTAAGTAARSGDSVGVMPLRRLC